MQLVITQKSGKPLLTDGTVVLRSDGSEVAARVSYSLAFKPRFGFTLARRADEGRFTAGVTLFGTNVNVGLESGWMLGASERELSAVVDGDAGFVHWTLWADPMGNGWSWRRDCFDVGRALLGDLEQREELVSQQETELLLPEGAYPCTARVFRFEVWNARFPKLTRHSFRRVDLEFAAPYPPFPGKGESPHDIDDDYVQKSSGPADSVEEALADVWKSVMGRRARYGGTGWRPAKPPVASPAPPQPEGSSSGSAAMPTADAHKSDRRFAGLALGVSENAIEVHRSGACGMVLAVVSHRPDDAQIQEALPFLKSLRASIPGVATSYVVLNIAGTLKLVDSGNGSLHAFDAWKVWPGALPKSAFVSPQPYLA